MKRLFLAGFLVVSVFAFAQERTATFVDAEHHRWTFVPGTADRGGVSVMVSARSDQKYSAEINGPENQQAVLDSFLQHLRENGVTLAAGPETSDLRLLARLDWATLGGAKLHVELVDREGTTVWQRQFSDKRGTPAWTKRYLRMTAATLAELDTKLRESSFSRVWQTPYETSKIVTR